MSSTNNYDQARQLLSAKTNINLQQSFAIAKSCSELLANDETAGRGRDLVIRVLDAMDRIDKQTHELWNDIVESAGLNPYVRDGSLSGSALVRREFYRSKVLDKIFHDEQMKIAMLLHSSKSVIVSAPTSFGKSLLIEEIVASQKYNNIVIIQPTLALLDETRKAMKKYGDTYDIILTTSQRPSKPRNIFLFTGERAAEYKFYPQIEFFVIDEFYKLSQDRDDERSAILNVALYRLLKMTKRFYMLGPSIDKVDPTAIKETNASLVRTDYATVAVDNHTVDVIGKVRLGGRAAVKDAKEQQLFSLLLHMEGPTLIYCKSPGEINSLVPKFLNYLVRENVDQVEPPSAGIKNTIEWIDENIHEKWHFSKALSYSIGIHHGALPRHLSSAVVDLFNNGKLRYLFCTSTLIEGVNTSAKNVVLFDRHKGKKPIDYFDFKNIVGRTGRMSQHYLGRVFHFHPEPEHLEMLVDVPLFSQNKATLDLLVQLDANDVKNSAKEQMANWSKVKDEYKDAIKSNIGASVEGQIQLIKDLEESSHDKEHLLSWNTVPTYPQLSYVIGLGWKSLLKTSGHDGGAFSANHLAVVALKYYHMKSLKPIIEEEVKSPFWVEKIPDKDQRVQTIVHTILQISRTWFGYKLPKMLTVISNLQEFVMNRIGKQAGNYTYFAKAIENRMLPESLAALIDYGLPASALIKLSKKYNDEISISETISKLRNDDLSRLGLLPYEIQKIKLL